MENKIIKHAAAIENYFATKDLKALTNYLRSLDPLDMVEAQKEFTAVFKKVCELKGFDIPEEEFNKVDNLTDALQELHLEGKLLQLQWDMKLNLDKFIVPMYEHIEAVRLYYKQGNAENNPKVIELNYFAKAIIDYEKRNNLYIKENWEGIEDKI